MKPLPFWTKPGCVIEIGQSAIKVLDQDRGLELPIARLESGRIDPSCTDRVISGLRSFLKSAGGRQRAFCALAARGVSLRRLTLPVTAPDELRRLLLLQLESELPLPPDAFAWGFYHAPNGVVATGAPVREVVVAAIKRDAVLEYADLLSKCGLDPVFTLAALARQGVCPRDSRPYSILEIGDHSSELALFEDGVLTAARILPWGHEDIIRIIQARLALSREQAERQDAALGGRAHLDPHTSLELDTCVQAGAETLAGLINRHPSGSKLYLTGETSSVPSFPVALAKALGSETACESIALPQTSGTSAATLGLRSLCSESGAPPLTFDIAPEQPAQTQSHSDRRRWIALSCALVLILIGFRYGEALIRRPQLARKVAQVSSQRTGLPAIDRELEFLSYLQSNQPPYLEALWLVANAAPSGTRLDSVSMTRRGDIALRGSMASSQQTTDLRSKLIESGFFSAVVLDEQAPTADRQKITFRLTAQLKPTGERPVLAALPATGARAATASLSTSPVTEPKPAPAKSASAPASSSVDRP